MRRNPLCDPCRQWLRGVIGEVRGHETGLPASLLGMPSTAGRALVFEDQCQVCHALPKGRGAMIDCITLGGGESWTPFFACTSCAAWVASLAEDGRSARRKASRSIDGDYGEWPHANLRDLVVALDIADPGARTTALETCAAMGVTVTSAPVESSILLVEARPGRSIAANVRVAASAGRTIIVLAHLASEDELRDALGAGVSSWLTIPVTPQQIAAALGATLRRGLPHRWDDSTCLPIGNLEGFTRPGIAFEPAGISPFTLAWLLRRFARGYDDLVWADGQVVLLPRVPAERVEAVQARLELLLAGRCRAVPLVPAVANRTRLDFAG